MQTDDKFQIPPDLTIGEAFEFLPHAENVNWGMAAFNVDALRRHYDGTGVKIGVIDTGVDAEHPILKGQVLGARDFTNSPIGARDRHGHGTHCSGTCAASDPRIGVAPGAKLYHGKGLSDTGSGSGVAIVAAMRWCFDQGCRVLSMSLGSAAPNPLIDEAGRELAARGCWIVAAAGNSGGRTANVDFPARFPWALAVAAIDAAFNPAAFTNAGDKIDTSGPGVRIWSARPGGGYQEMNGTSMATPFVAGVCALIMSGYLAKSKPVPSVEQLREMLSVGSTDTFQPGRDRRTGPGWITPVLFDLDLATEPPPPLA